MRETRSLEVRRHRIVLRVNAKDRRLLTLVLRWNAARLPSRESRQKGQRNRIVRPRRILEAWVDLPRHVQLLAAREAYELNHVLLQIEPRIQPHPRPIPDIECETGITVGQLLDRAKELEVQHVLCPYAEAEQLVEDGLVRAPATFTATTELDENDPIRLETLRKLEETQRPDYVETDVELMVAHPNAKRHALTNGYQVPTLAQFEVASGRSYTTKSLDPPVEIAETVAD